ncbi:MULTISPECIES: LysR family transcriptional regulator [Ramlibacter]|uniref:LysR family transcriptional regulator n=1 Tax=Ramlibacter pinisoli TaxID=2682844 RepID=A0A6N8IWK6_9BURK|nr:MULTISPECIES: LysR family transcriptional regulator [Ramlibacter]MBA2965399.1 LysR family transcriptional regulator [Ramlibacter sp. CGMCC 1.13660]MVQ30363.1 LysR family transcriptional regulator [Ramlibacter pinisoli]
MFDWDDLKPLLAVARHGSTTAAARALGVDQSTVQRRLVELERRIGQPLVQRSPSGYRLTAYGAELLPLAEAVEQQVARLEDKIRRSAREVNGLLRLTCPEPLVPRITRSPLLDHLHARHPGLRLEFITTDHYVDLTRGEADVALRSGDTVDNQLVGRKVGQSLWAVYAGRGYLGPRAAPASLAAAAGLDWVALDATMPKHRSTQWMRQAAPDARIAATSGSVLGLVHAAKAGVGLAALPTALGDAEPDLVRLFGPVPELTRIWRLLTTRALRRTPRVASFFDFMVQETATLRPILTG